MQNPPSPSGKDEIVWCALIATNCIEVSTTLCAIIQEKQQMPEENEFVITISATLEPRDHPMVEIGKYGILYLR